MVTALLPVPGRWQPLASGGRWRARLGACVTALASTGILAAGPVPLASAQSTLRAVGYKLTETWTDAPWTIAAGRFHTVGDIATAADGTTFVLDTEQRAVHTVDAAGRPVSVWYLAAPFAPSGACQPRRLDVGPDDRVYVLGTCDLGEDLPLGAETIRSHLLILERDGSPRRSLELSLPYSDVALDPQGRVLLARTRPTVLPTPEPGGEREALPGGIDRLDAAGSVETRIEHAALFAPVSLDVAPDGTIYVANRVPSEWYDDDPRPRPTPEPALLRATQATTAVEGVVVLAPDAAYLHTVPFTTPEDVAAAPAGAFVSRNVEVFAVGSAQPIWSGPPGQVVVGSSDGVIIHLAASAGRLRAGMRHCYFQGVLDFGVGSAATSSTAAREPRLIGSLDRPELSGPVNASRLDADELVAVLQDRFTIAGTPPDRRYAAGLQPTQPQSVQRWTPSGDLRDQLGVCAGGTSVWLEERGSALLVGDVAVDGSVVYTVDANLVTARPSGGFPAWSFWPGTLNADGPPPRLAAVSADEGLVAVLDVGSGAVVILRRDGVVTKRFTLPSDDGTAVATDIAVRQGIIWVAEAAAHRLLAYDETGALLRDVTVVDDPWRIDATADGGVVALSRSGWAARYTRDGSLLASWSAPDPSADAMDIAVRASGSVLVAWVVREAEPESSPTGPDFALRSSGVWVFEETDSPAPPLPTAADGCVVLPDKDASPTSVRLCQTVTVTLTIDGHCPGSWQRADVVLLLDSSRSMNWNGALDRARQLSVAFLEGLKPGAVRVALVTFASDAALRVPLTSDIGSVAARVTSIDAWGDTHLAPGLEVATDELLGNRADPSAEHYIVIVSDGEYTDRARAAAETARARGVELRAVAVPHGGVSSYLDALVAVTGDRRLVFVDPDPDALERRAREWVGYRPEPRLLLHANVDDVIPANMAYIEGSARPAAGRRLQDRLRWSLPLPSAPPLSVTLRVMPLSLGVWPTNVSATAVYTDMAGLAGQLVFPLPRVYVWDASMLDRHVFLPFMARSSCFRFKQRADVVLAIDASESMAGPAETGGTKLAAAGAAAEAFTSLLRLPSDRAAIVAFNRRATRLSSLTGDRGQLREALARLQSAPGTRIDLALQECGRILEAAPRQGAEQVVILLSDGNHVGDVADVDRAADQLRAKHVIVFTIGLGADADDRLLQRIATESGAYYGSPAMADLEAIYRKLLQSLACVPGSV